MISLVHNELVKVLFKRRTYISFILITLLIPALVYAIDYGAISLQNKIYGQMQDSFIFIGSVINGYFASYLIIAVLINHMPFQGSAKMQTKNAMVSKARPNCDSTRSFITGGIG